MTTFQRLFIMIFAVTLVSLSACKKDNFDEPPYETVDPNLPVTHTIADLKTLLSGNNTQLTDDITIAGIVVANDKSGNIFNQIIIDDGTAGISVAIDQNGLFGEFPVGRKIYVKCKSLYLASDNNLIGLYGALDITNSPIEIPSALISKYIVKANSGNPVVPIEVADIDDLNTSFQNRLVKLSNVEFDEADANQPYADAVNKKSVSRVLEECDGDNLEVRSSGYANFAANLTPKGKGTIIGIYTVFGTDKQIILRDGNETDMNGIKCDGSDPNARVIFEENFNSIALANNAVLVIPNWKNITEVASVPFKFGNPFSSLKCAIAETFGTSTGTNVTSWLISPSINLDASTSEKLTFTTAVRNSSISGSSTFAAYISTDYDGGNNPQNFTWTNLNATIAVPSGSSTFSPFLSSGIIDISGYSGNIYIAFKYVAVSGGRTTELDDIKVTGL